MLLKNAVFLTNKFKSFLKNCLWFKNKFDSPRAQITPNESH